MSYTLELLRMESEHSFWQPHHVLGGCTISNDLNEVNPVGQPDALTNGSNSDMVSTLPHAAHDAAGCGLRACCEKPATEKPGNPMHSYCKCLVVT